MASKKTIRGNRDETYVIDESDLKLTVAKSATIRALSDTSAIHDAIYVTFGASNTHLVVDGRLFATRENSSQGISFRGTGSVEIGRSGEVTGSEGIMIRSSQFRFDNEGRITAVDVAGTGLDVQGLQGGMSLGANIHNSGTISGSDGAVIYAKGVFVNEARGKIIGDSTGLVIGGGDDTFVNHGLIKGGAYSILITSLEGAHIRNDGNIVGNFVGGSGDDVIDMRGGKINGSVSGNGGNDTLITDKASIYLSELDGYGAFDVVKSTVSYTLGDNVEYLYLLGKKNISGTGNAANNADNYFYGNSGTNVLKGVGDGNNEFYGGKGNDTYIGVDGEYDLYGLGHRGGRETVRTYVDGEDLIDLTGFNGFDDDTPFENLQSHFKQKGTDTWIDMGRGDILILKGVDSEVLDENDFLFNF